MKDLERYSTQLTLFNPEKYENKSVSIVGVGSIGSFTAIVLAKMGISTLNVYDDDTIENHNIPNQFYMKKQIGQKKTSALKTIVTEFSDAKIFCGGKVTTKTTLMSDIIIACTDSMESRKLAYKNSKLANYFIDARMSGNTYRIYTLDLTNKKDREDYEKTLYSDKNSDKGLCTEKTIVYNVSEIAGKIGNQVRKLLNGEKYSHCIIYDFQNDVLIKK